MLISRGAQNQQTIEQTKQFLAENRTLVVSVFKRQAGIGVGSGGEDSTMDSVDELVDLFALLMTSTEFINVSKTFFISSDLFPICYCGRREGQG